MTELAFLNSRTQLLVNSALVSKGNQSIMNPLYVTNGLSGNITGNITAEGLALSSHFSPQPSPVLEGWGVRDEGWVSCLTFSVPSWRDEALETRVESVI